MNNIHKVIFNKNIQQFVVVSELAKSAGKAKAIFADTLDIASLLQNFSKKRPLVPTDNINTAELTAAMVRTHLTDIKLPQASLYKINPDSPNGYLVETDPKFTDRKQWLSSDYMFEQLRHNFDNVHKRLDDGFYEQRLINEQINQLTGRRFIQGYNNDLEQYKALMNNGVKYAKEFNLAVGVGLTAKQMSELTTDMVWLVNKEITLADGRKVTALVPQVYLVARNSDITSRGAVISANQIIGNVDNLQNSGVIAGLDLTRLHSNQLENRGTILGDTVDLSAKQNLINLGGKIEAVKELSLYAGKNLEISSTLSSSQSADGNFARTVLDQLASVKVTGEGGRLTLHSDDNLTIKAANIESQGALNATAGKSLQITTLKTQNREHYNGNADNYYRLDQEAEVGTRLSGKDGVKLFGVDGVTLRQVDVRGDGDVSVISQKGNITLESGRAKESLATSVKSTSKGLFSKSSRLSEHEHQTDVAVVNSLQGQNITLYAGNKITDEGSVIKGGDHIYLEGKYGVELNTAQNTHSERNYTELKKAGLTASLSSGTARIGVGRNKQKDANTERQISHIGTQLNTENGNITVVSTQGDVTANATQFDAKKDIAIEGQNVYLNAEIDKQDNQESHYAKSAGFGIGVVYNLVARFKDYYGEQSSQGSAKGIVGKVVTAGEAIDKTSQQLLNGVGSYFTANKKQQERFNQTEKANMVEMNSGGNLAIHANKGSIVSQGSHISAKGDGTFGAKENVHFDVATTEQSQSGKLKQKGVDIDSSRRLTDIVGVYSGKEKGDGELVQEQAGVLSFGGATTVVAEKGDITLAGTQLVSDGKVKLSAGNNNVNITTAKTTQGQDEAGKSHGFGEAVISETERFSGYNRKLNSQNGHAVSHQGSMIASLKDDVEIYAGKNFHSTSGQILAKNRIGIDAEEVTFDTAHNTGNSQSHSSDLKIGQFSRVSSPLIDLIQSVEQAVNNKEASDRVRLAQALGTAAKAYSTAGDLANGGALFRVETGTGFSHSRERNETASRESVGNQLNAQHIDITSHSGDITATHTAFTSRDEQGKRLNDSSITFNSAKELNLNAGQSEYRMKGRQQSSGFEAGTGVAVGAQTGWYVYAQAGFSHGKQDEYHLTHQNSQIDTDTLNINTQGNTTLQGAVAKANTINADIKGNLTVENLQDIHQSESDSAGFGGRVQAAIGTAWGGSAYGNMASGSSNVKQVVEQSGLFAEEGGYHITANNVELTGGAIASHNPANSTLTTNTITFKDIQNESSSQAVSAGISASANLNKQAGTEAKTEAKAKQQAKVAKLTGTSQSNGINPSVPMFDSSRDSSTTKATLTEGTIILNKDTHPTQTTAKALGINTDLSQANRQVEQPKDIKQVLKEQQILSQAAGNVAGAVMTYVDNQKAELEKAKEKAREEAKTAEQAGDLITAERKHYEAQMLDRETARWESGGDNKRKATVVATALSLAVAGKPAEAIAAGVASPYINEAIKHITENTDNKALEALNVPLHILWGAVEAELAGGNAKAGAVATGVGEIGARVLAETVYGKQPNELNEEEKQNLLTTSKALAGIAVAGTTGSTGAETLANASVGMTVAENAVENNAVNQKQAGTAEEFEVTLNSTTRKVGLAIGDEAEKYLLEFGEIENFQPAKTGFSNKFDDRYIYTEVGGWIDMTHFIFYAGRAYRNKLNSQEKISKYLGFVPEDGAVKSAISNKARAEAIALGYLQEASDTILAPHSKFSYEDLPSDRFGAEFGSKYFNKNSPMSLGEQIKSYLVNELKATLPTKAPNYRELPKEDTQIHPGYYNFSTSPMYKGGK